MLAQERISTTRDVYATTVSIQVMREWLGCVDGSSPEEAARRHAKELRDCEAAEPLPGLNTD